MPTHVPSGARALARVSVVVSLALFAAGCATKHRTAPPPPPPPPPPVTPMPPPAAEIPVQVTAGPPGWATASLPATASGDLMALPVGDDAAGYHTVTVFYGTNRPWTGVSRASVPYFSGGMNWQIQYGTCQVSIPHGHTAGRRESPFLANVPYLDRYAYLFEDPTVHVVLLDVARLDRASFLGRLRERVNLSAGKSAFVFVHGYNVSFKDACRQTAQVAWDMKFAGAPVMYSWPSDAALKNYGTDEERMNASVGMLEEFLWTIARDSGAQQVHIIAHSLGSRAVTAALNRMYEHRQVRQQVFDRVVMAAADIRAELFAHDRSAVQALSQSVTLYLSDSDVALKASGNVVHPGDRRVGIRPSPMVFYDGIDIVDASSVNYAWLGINHSYWSDKWQAIQDLSDLLRHVNQRRPLLREQSGPAGRYWVLEVGR